MFHHNDRVAQVAQFLERTDEAGVVALMEADARLIEDIKHVDQLRTDLCGQTDALAFASGKRG